tara:strand:+ start:1258 stop:1788 length:531 start_codon:yes stop_codon:yes gene_type:complete
MLLKNSLFKRKNIIVYVILLICLNTKAQENKINIKPSKAALYSTLLPGLGQIKTKKYWKVPIIYAGLLTSGYFIKKNYSNYKTYKNIFIDRVNGDKTDEYIDIYSDADIKTLTEHYRRNTEVSTLLFTLTYILNIIDASVNAHLMKYNISEDLSIEITPINLVNNKGATLNLLINI